MISDLSKMIRISPTGMVFYILLSAVLVISQLSGILITSISDFETALSFQQELGNRYNELIAQIQSNETYSTVILFFITMFAGGILFTAPRTIFGPLADIKEHIEVSLHYVKPKDFKLGEYWSKFFAALLIKGIFLGLLVSYSILWYKVILPAARVALDSYYQNQADGDLFDVIVAVLALPLSIHVFTVLLRLILLTRPE